MPLLTIHQHVGCADRNRRATHVVPIGDSRAPRNARRAKSRSSSIVTSCGCCSQCARACRLSCNPIGSAIDLICLVPVRRSARARHRLTAAPRRKITAHPPPPIWTPPRARVRLRPHLPARPACPRTQASAWRPRARRLPRLCRAALERRAALRPLHRGRRQRPTRRQASRRHPGAASRCAPRARWPRARMRPRRQHRRPSPHREASITGTGPAALATPSLTDAARKADRTCPDEANDRDCRRQGVAGGVVPCGWHERHGGAPRSRCNSTTSVGASDVELVGDWAKLQGLQTQEPSTAARERRARCMVPRPTSRRQRASCGARHMSSIG